MTLLLYIIVIRIHFQVTLVAAQSATIVRLMQRFTSNDAIQKVTLTPMLSQTALENVVHSVNIQNVNQILNYRKVHNGTFA